MILRHMVNKILDWSPQYRRPVETINELPDNPGRYTGIYVEEANDIYLWHPDLECWHGTKRFNEIVESKFVDEHKLRECPYCRTNEGVKITFENGILLVDSEAGHVCCENCDAHGPIRDILEESIADWNSVSLKNKTGI